MSRFVLRARNVAGAASALGGVVVVAAPQHAGTVLQVVVVAAAGGAVVAALGTLVPPTGWMSPFRWMSPFSPPTSRAGRLRSGDLDTVRERLTGRRQPIPCGPPLPPEVLRRLQPLVRRALDLDPDDATPPPEHVRGRVSAALWGVLTTQPLTRPGWLATHRPHPRAVADAVRTLLDEVDRLTREGRRPVHAGRALDPPSTPSP